MIQKSDEMSKELKITIALLIALIALTTFYPLLHVGFTTDDDTKGAIRAAMSFRDELDYMIMAAKNTGRVSFIVNFPLADLPYAVDSFIYYKIVALGSVIMNIFLFGYVLKRIFNSAALSLMAIAFFLIFLQVSWQYNLITAYPFSFHFGLSMFILSAISLHKYIITTRKKYQIISAFVFIIPLVIYETFILYFVLFVFMVYFGTIHNKKRITEAPFELFRHLFLHFAIIAVYLLAYFSFKHHYSNLVAAAAGSTDGYQIAEFSASKALKVIYQLSISSFPTYLYWHYGDLFRTSSDLFSGHQNSLFYIVRNAKVEWIVKSVLSAYLVYLVLKYKKTNLSLSQFKLLVLVSIILLFIPVLPLSTTLKYQDWVLKYGGLEYTVTYFSLFGTVLLFGSITLYGMQILSTRNIAARFYISLVAVLIALASLITDYSNSYVAKSQVMSQLKWDTLNLFMKTPVFKDIPDGSIVYAPTLWGIIGYPETYWSEYIHVKTGKKLNIIKTRDTFKNELRQVNGTTEKDVYLLKYTQEPKDTNQYIIFSPLKNIIEANNNDYFISDTVHVYYYSKYKRFLVHMNLISNNTDNNLSLNGHLLGPVDNSVGSLVLEEGHNVDKNSPLFHTVISYKHIDVNSVSISNFLDYYAPVDKKYFASLKDVRGIKVEFTEGFNGLERNEKDDWRWCGKEGALVLENDSLEDKSVTLAMGLATGYEQASEIVISHKTFRDNLKINSEVSQYKRQVTVPKKSKVEIHFSCNAPGVHAASETRLLVFKVINMKIKEYPAQFLLR